MFCKPDILVYPSPAADGYWTYFLQPSCIANSHWFNDQTRIKYKINYIPYRLFNCSVRGTNLSINLPTVLGYDISLRTGKKLQQSWSGYTFLHCAWRLVRLKIPKVRICRFFFFLHTSAYRAFLNNWHTFDISQSIAAHLCFPCQFIFLFLLFLFIFFFPLRTLFWNLKFTKMYANSLRQLLIRGQSLYLICILLDKTGGM